MAITYDLGTDAGKVRLIIADNREDGHVLEDPEVQAFLDLNGGSIRLAAADALDTIATNEALVQKVITLLDLRTDGAKTADALRKHAALLRSLAAKEPGGMNEAAWAIGENPVTVWAVEEYAWNWAVAHA